MYRHLTLFFPEQLTVKYDKETTKKHAWKNDKYSDMKVKSSFVDYCALVAGLKGVGLMKIAELKAAVLMKLAGLEARSSCTMTVQKMARSFRNADVF